MGECGPFLCGEIGLESEKVGVEAGVVGELGVEGGAEDAALLDGDAVAFVGGDGGDGGAVGGDDGGAYEDGVDGLGESGDVDGVFEAVDLGAECVAADGDVEEGEGVLEFAGDGGGVFDGLAEEDHAHASAPEGEVAGEGALADGVAEAVAFEEEADGGGFSAGEDEVGDAFELFGGADFADGGDAEGLERVDVAFEIALDGEHTDLGRGRWHGSSLARLGRGCLSRMSVMLDILGVPFDLGGRRVGSRLGPSAIRLEGVRQSLRQIGRDVEDLGDVVPLISDVIADRGVVAEAVEGMVRVLSERVEQSIGRGRKPLVLGGDHSLSIGSVAGAMRALDGDLAVLWVDAHIDLNTPATSPSGNIHGMPVAALNRMRNGAENPALDAGYRETLDRVWDRILSDVVPEPGLEGRVAWIGLRDVDYGEVRNLETLRGAKCFTMQDVDHLGIPRVIEEFDGWMRETRAKHLWVSFDVDALDPVWAPGTGTAVRGGLTYREAHTLAEYIYELVTDESSPYRLAGMDVVETNPLADRENETAKIAVEWIGSVLGKTVLHQYEARK